MALTGLQIYKLLPQTNCKECGFATCLAFGMKLAAKQAELKLCPYVTDEARAQLEASSAPPIRLIAVASDGAKLEVGNETVLFRHEKTFYNPAGVFVRVLDTMPAAEITALAKAVADYKVDYVGMSLHVDGLAVECASGDPTAFALAVATVNAAVTLPLILVSEDPKVLEAGVAKMGGVKPLLCAATAAKPNAAHAARHYRRSASGRAERQACNSASWSG